MARQARVAVGGVVYHIINRANGREQIFSTDAEYAHFESLLLEGVKITGTGTVNFIRGMGTVVDTHNLGATLRGTGRPKGSKNR